MKKGFLLFILTLILTLPICYWMRFRWGLSFKPFNLNRFKISFARDIFFQIMLVMNSCFYIFAVIKIFGYQDGRSERKDINVENNITDSDYMNIVNNTGRSINMADERWKNLYNGNNNIVEKKVTESIVASSSLSAEVPETIIIDNILNIDEINSDIYLSTITDELDGIGYQTLGGVGIDGVEINFISVASDDTLILGFINKKNGDIIANEIVGDMGEEPSWFINQEAFISPVYNMQIAVSAVEKMIAEVLPADNGVKVMGLVILKESEILNISDIKDLWDKSGIKVAKIVSDKNIPNILDIIPNKSSEELLPSYKKFVETLIKYFMQKEKSQPFKKAV